MGVIDMIRIPGLWILQWRNIWIAKISIEESPMMGASCEGKSELKDGEDKAKGKIFNKI